MLILSITIEYPLTRKPGTPSPPIKSFPIKSP